jgi:hypothetical protein
MRQIHPVLLHVLAPYQKVLEGASLEELQVVPGLSAQYWCGQQVVEHLMMTMERSRSELTKRLEQRRSKMSKRSLLQAIIKSHLFWFRSMPRGILAPRSLRPAEWTPASGSVLAEKLLVACKGLDDVLVSSRRAFGMEPCGEHWMYGPLRVEDWRAYHAIHLQHHMKQLKAAIAYAKNPPSLADQKLDVLSSGWFGSGKPKATQ